MHLCTAFTELARGSFVFPKEVLIYHYICNDFKRCFEIALSRNADFKKKKKKGNREVYVNKIILLFKLVSKYKCILSVYWHC